jgi:hypothetical protein
VFTQPHFLLGVRLAAWAISPNVPKQHLQALLEVKESILKRSLRGSILGRAAIAWVSGCSNRLLVIERL